MGQAEGLHVVVVEDTPDLAGFLVTMLQMDGAQVTAVSDDFDQLLHDAMWQGVDAALVDLMLGGETTGATVLQFLVEHQPHVRRVVLTAAPSLAEMVGEAAHVTLLKPSSAERIIEALTGGGSAD